MYHIKTHEGYVYVLDHKDLAAIKQIIILLGHDPSQCTIDFTSIDPIYHLVKLSGDQEAYRLKNGKLDKVFFKETYEKA